jgi:hypothetical protein
MPNTEPSSGPWTHAAAPASRRGQAQTRLEAPSALRAGAGRRFFVPICVCFLQGPLTGAVQGVQVKPTGSTREDNEVSTTQQRQSRATGQLSTVRSLPQARRSNLRRRRPAGQAPVSPFASASVSPVSNVQLPALVKRVQSYLEVGRT